MAEYAKSSIVTNEEVVGGITRGVRKLRSADDPPAVSVPCGGRPFLYVTRNGNTESLPISRRVAEELIAAGFTYGD